MRWKSISKPAKIEFRGKGVEVSSVLQLGVLSILSFENNTNYFVGTECLCHPNQRDDITEVLLELSLQHCPVPYWAFLQVGLKQEKAPKTSLTFFPVGNLSALRFKHCTNVKHVTAVYLMITFRSRCTCLLFQQLKSSHSPSFTSAVVFGSPSQLLAAGQVPGDFLPTGHRPVLAGICLQFHSASYSREKGKCREFFRTAL